MAYKCNIILFSSSKILHENSKCFFFSDDFFCNIFVMGSPSGSNGRTGGGELYAKGGGGGVSLWGGEGGGGGGRVSTCMKES